MLVRVRALIIHHLAHNVSNAPQRCDHFVRNTVAHEVQHVVFARQAQVIVVFADVFAGEHLAKFVLVKQIYQLQLRHFLVRTLLHYVVGLEAHLLLLRL